MTKTIQLDTLPIIDDLSRLSIEVEARKELISFMITNNMSCETSQFIKYQNEYLDYFSQYQKKKQEFEKMIKTQLVGSKETLLTWNLDFDTRQVTITTNEKI